MQSMRIPQSRKQISRPMVVSASNRVFRKAFLRLLRSRAIRAGEMGAAAVIVIVFVISYPSVFFVF